MQKKKINKWKLINTLGVMQKNNKIKLLNTFEFMQKNDRSYQIILELYKKKIEAKYLWNYANKMT